MFALSVWHDQIGSPPFLLHHVAGPLFINTYIYEVSCGFSAERNKLGFFSENKPEHGPDDKSCQCPHATHNVHASRTASLWGPQGPLGAMLGSSTTEGGTGPSPGDFVQVTRCCSQCSLVHNCYSSALRTQTPFSWQSQYFPHIDNQRLFRKIGPNEVLLPL